MKPWGKLSIQMCPAQSAETLTHSSKVWSSCIKYLSQRPCDWEDLVQRLHIVTVNTGTFAPYNLPYQNLQRAFYVAGGAAACLNFIMELDNCIVYTVEHDDKPKYGQFLLQVEMSVNVDFEFTKENFDYPLVEITRDVFPKDMAITPLNV